MDTDRKWKYVSLPCGRGGCGPIAASPDNYVGCYHEDQQPTTRNAWYIDERPSKSQSQSQTMTEPENDFCDGPSASCRKIDDTEKSCQDSRGYYDDWDCGQTNQACGHPRRAGVCGMNGLSTNYCGKYSQRSLVTSPAGESNTNVVCKDSASSSSSSSSIGTTTYTHYCHNFKDHSCAAFWNNSSCESARDKGNGMGNEKSSYSYSYPRPQCMASYVVRSRDTNMVHDQETKTGSGSSSNRKIVFVSRVWRSIGGTVEKGDDQKEKPTSAATQEQPSSATQEKPTSAATQEQPTSEQTQEPPPPNAFPINAVSLYPIAESPDSRHQGVYSQPDQTQGQTSSDYVKMEEQTEHSQAESDADDGVINRDIGHYTELDTSLVLVQPKLEMGSPGFIEDDTVGDEEQSTLEMGSPGFTKDDTAEVERDDSSVVDSARRIDDLVSKCSRYPYQTTWFTPEVGRPNAGRAMSFSHTDSGTGDKSGATEKRQSRNYVSVLYKENNIMHPLVCSIEYDDDVLRDSSHDEERLKNTRELTELEIELLLETTKEGDNSNNEMVNPVDSYNEEQSAIEKQCVGCKADDRTQRQGEALLCCHPPVENSSETRHEKENAETEKDCSDDTFSSDDVFKTVRLCEDEDNRPQTVSSINAECNNPNSVTLSANATLLYPETASDEFCKVCDQDGGLTLSGNGHVSKSVITTDLDPKDDDTCSVNGHKNGIGTEVDVYDSDACSKSDSDNTTTTVDGGQPNDAAIPSPCLVGTTSFCGARVTASGRYDTDTISPIPIPRKSTGKTPVSRFLNSFCFSSRSSSIVSCSSRSSFDGSALSLEWDEYDDGLLS